MPTALFIDSMGLVFRAYHAMSKSGFKAPNGEPTGAVFGFANMITAILDAEKPDFIAAAFDTSAPTFRHDRYDGYKAHRDEFPEELVPQMPRIKEFLRLIGVPVLELPGFEADDIIGTLVPRHIMHEDIVIISSDGDFLQLQMYNGRSDYTVKQYNPAQKKFLISKNPMDELKEKIIHGDKGDGIPNILSPSDTFVREIRQKVMTEAKLTKFMGQNYAEYDDENARIGFSRNQTLIDLRNIPGDIQSKIINTYEETKPAPKGKILDYLITNKLKSLIDVIGEF